ncbi:MAG TPA: SIS domain-containing protein [Acidimicrobiales bacterium]|nr:SIS domain-containing protein [Acidimicrobiales bacterium]
MSGGGSPPGPAWPPSPLAVDTLSMWESAVGLPEDLVAVVASGPPDGLPGAEQVRGVLVHAVDEGGLAGALGAAVARGTSPLPVVPATGFQLPAWVDSGWVVVVASWSGDDEESLAVAEEAGTVGATVVVVSGGGSLVELAGRLGWPVATLAPPPAGGPGVAPGIGPRARLAPLVVPPLLVLDHLGLAPRIAPRLEAASSYLAHRRDRLASPGGPVTELARRIGRTVPLVHGSDGPSGVAALRWRAAFNLNAKSPALASLQPELCHDEIAGWGLGGDVTRQILTLVFLRHDDEDPRLERRFAIVDELMTEVVADVLHVRTEATDDLTRFLELSMVGELVSLLRAGEEGVDPGPVPALVGFSLGDAVDEQGPASRR